MHKTTDATPDAATEQLRREHEFDERDLYVWLFDGGAVPKTLFERVLRKAEREVDGMFFRAVLTPDDILSSEFLDQFGPLLHSMVLRILAHLALRKIVSLELVDCGLSDANLYRVK